MKKLLSSMLLIIVSTNAMAEWTLIGGSDSSDLYADFNSVQKNGNKVKMWILYDYKQPVKDTTGVESLSLVTLDEFDCVNVTSRALSISRYTGNMQKGTMISKSDYGVGESTHEIIVPNTIGKTTWIFACGKKK